MLVNPCTAADESERADVNMTREHDVVRKNDVISHRAIMPHVGGGHQHAILADSGEATRVRGSVDGYVFTNDRASADADAGQDKRVKTEILWKPSNDREGVDLNTFFEHCPGPQNHVCRESGAGPNRNAFLDDCVWTDFYVGPEVGIGIYNGGLMNHTRRRFRGTLAFPQGASKTKSMFEKLCCRSVASPHGRTN